MNPEPTFGVHRSYCVAYDSREEAEAYCHWWAGDYVVVSWDGGETWEAAA